MTIILFDDPQNVTIRHLMPGDVIVRAGYQSGETATVTRTQYLGNGCYRVTQKKGRDAEPQSFRRDKLSRVTLVGFDTDWMSNRVAESGARAEKAEAHQPG
jgi:hypothetical protein